MPLGG
jgi:hypothetical protein